MIQTSVLVDDQDPIPQSPFRLLLENVLTFNEPLICEEFLRCKDNKIVTLEVFDDQIVEVCGKKKSILLLEEEIFFGWCSNDRKIWFKNRENQDIQVLRSESLNNLINFVEALKKRCPQENFLSKYELLEQKGKGKNSCVYQGKRRSDGRSYAIKIQNYTLELANQIRTLRQLQHPNVIYFHEYFIDTENIVHIVMDYEDGGSLLDLIRRNQQLSPKDKVKIFMDLLNGLEYLRIKGIVHRDLKPQNILFSKKDRNYKIADFGLSKRVGEKLQKIAGTPGYMAPELLKSESKEMTADIKSDIYSMGLIFYQVLTLHQYYQGKDTQQILKRNMQKTSLKKKNKCENLINNLQYILLEKMIRSEPEKRKSSYQILKSSLFSKINKSYGLELLSSTSPSKKISDDNEEDQNNDGFVDSIWKFLRSRSWSTST